MIEVELTVEGVELEARRSRFVGDGPLRKGAGEAEGVFIAVELVGER